MSHSSQIIETKSAFAARVGLSGARISQLVKRGLPLSSDGKVLVADALRWMREEVNAKGGRPLGSSGTGGEGDPDYEAAKLRLTIAQADRAELEIAARRRELVPVDEARRAQRAVARTTRDMFLNFSARYGPEMAGELGVDPGLLIGILEAKIRTALNEAAAKPPVFDEGKE
ncbi:hypothetical protein G6M78_08290 [Agrobacterium tumefaciens]|uniref:hypothetical protein n=1 Tax=Agrobacterium tumefaciens TaxID=358 RepID=UPI001571D4AB|nr:hypothetical protein [Agrobacterium tumefaciens]NTE55078.1 hypothetical protein [Agrobacterium tumefaciens]NTE73846.1 hypothetical protein [Agrobacterium tumefaciens]